MSKLSKKTKSVQGRCFLCGGAFESGFKGMAAEGGIYGVDFCGSCGLGKTTPFLDEKELKRIYSSTYRENDSSRFFSPIEKIVKVIRVERCKRVERYAKKGKILDVGCGRGDFLALMKERGWTPTGLELDSRIEGHGRKVGMDLRCGSLDTIKFPDAHFDAVTFWHVFEHLRNPDAALKECARILKPGGLLVVAVPNAGSLQAKMTGKSWFHLDPPFHLYHYSLKNLLTLLGKYGFKSEGLKHFSFEYNPYGYLQSVFNSLGFRNNLFYDFLRSKSEAKKAYLSLAMMFALMPIALPASMFLSVFEAIAGYGGTIEIYAKKSS